MESELVAVDDCMPAICWTRYFLEAQGYNVAENILYQDNQSAILLEKNGKASSGKRTKHINIRYFFVTDRIRANELNVEWCPTGLMIGDFMAKPLQGTLFQRFRDLLMGVIKIDQTPPATLFAGVCWKKPMTDGRQFFSHTAITPHTFISTQLHIRDAGLPNLRTVNLVSIFTKKWSTLIYRNDPRFSTRRADCYLPISF
jgi:hypothetical protein